MTKKGYNHNLDVPNDLVGEILQNLPVKTVVKFKSVSKQWNTMITSKGFVQRHLIRQRSRGSKILSSSVPGTGCDAVSLTSLSVEKGDQIYCSYTLSGQFQPPLRFAGSSDGLVCVYDKVSIYVINPTTREIRKLPPPQIQSSDSNPSVTQDVPFSSVGFGRDQVTGTYKVVLMYTRRGHDVSDDQVQGHEGHTYCEVFALDTGIWRCVDHTPHEISSNQRLVCTNGSLYWFTKHIHPTVITFDLHEERFEATPNPGFSSHGYFSVYMYSRDDRLRVFILRRNVFEIWGMHPNGEWEKLWKLDYVSDTVPKDTRSNVHPSIFATHYIREKSPLPSFHARLISRSPELLCNMLCRDYEIPYIESLVSVFQ